MTYFSSYEEPAAGFTTVAGRGTGLRRLVLAAGQLGVDHGGPLHLHHGEEILACAWPVDRPLQQADTATERM